MVKANIFGKGYLTDEERRTPYWYRGERHEFYTSYDPNHTGIHIVPCSPTTEGNPSKGYNLPHLMHDIMMFTMYWWGQVKDRLNGFTAYHIKFILHEYGWTPKDGYDNAIIDTGNSLNFGN